MAQIYVFGRVMHELTPKESQSKQPYVCFDLMERSGGEHPNFYQVWARGDQVARLTRLKVKKGSMIWLTGSQKLVDVRQKDGATVKKLKVWLTDFGFLPGHGRRPRIPAGIKSGTARGTVPSFQNELKLGAVPFFVFKKNLKGRTVTT